MSLKESADTENYHLSMKKNSLIEDKMEDKVQRAHTGRKPQKAHPHWRFLLLLWYKMASLHYLVWL